MACKGACYKYKATTSLNTECMDLGGGVVLLVHNILNGMGFIVLVVIIALGHTLGIPK